MSSAEYESQITLKAEDLLPEHIIKHDHYTIDSKVENDGLMNTYSVSSDDGNFSVVSTVSLYKLLAELEAMILMRQAEESETFKDSLKETGEGTVEGVKRLFADPIESVEGAGRGLSNLFSRAHESIFMSDPGATEDSRVQQLIGFSQSKREVAEKFHVDVYSTNKVLQEQLDTLAWAEYAGGISLSIATLPLGGPLKVVYSSSNAVRLLNETIALTPPSELKKQNREKMTNMNIDHNLIDLFINNPHFSPRQQTYVVAAMESLSSTDHLEVIPMVALQVKDYEMASAITTLVVMYAGYNKHVAPITQMFPVQRIIGAQNKNGDTVILAPADHLTWNKLVAATLSASQRSSTSQVGEIWILGTASEQAITKFKEEGWKVETRVGNKIGLNEAGIPAEK